MIAAAALILSLPALASAQGPQNPPPPAGGGDGGPYGHQIGSASSSDGLTWTHDGGVLLEHCSVPAAIVLPDGRVRLYVVDSTERPENMNCAESSDGGRTFRMAGCTIANRGGAKALDPSVVRLSDGRYRLYYYASSPDVKTCTGVTCPARSGHVQCGSRCAVGRSGRQRDWYSQKRSFLKPARSRIPE